MYNYNGLLVSAGSTIGGRLELFNAKFSKLTGLRMIGCVMLK